MVYYNKLKHGKVQKLKSQVKYRRMMWSGYKHEFWERKREKKKRYKGKASEGQTRPSLELFFKNQF